MRVERGEIDRVGEMEESGVGRGETEAVQQIIDFDDVRYGIHAASVPSILSGRMEVFSDISRLTLRHQ